MKTSLNIRKMYSNKESFDPFSWVGVKSTIRDYFVPLIWICRVVKSGFKWLAKKLFKPLDKNLGHDTI